MMPVGYNEPAESPWLAVAGNLHLPAVGSRCCLLQRCAELNVLPQLEVIGVAAEVILNLLPTGVRGPAGGHGVIEVLGLCFGGYQVG